MGTASGDAGTQARPRLEKRVVEDRRDEARRFLDQACHARGCRPRIEARMLRRRAHDDRPVTARYEVDVGRGDESREAVGIARGVERDELAAHGDDRGGRHAGEMSRPRARRVHHGTGQDPARARLHARRPPAFHEHARDGRVRQERYARLLRGERERPPEARRRDLPFQGKRKSGPDRAAERRLPRACFLGREHLERQRACALPVERAVELDLLRVARGDRKAAARVVLAGEPALLLDGLDPFRIEMAGKEAEVPYRLGVDARVRLRVEETRRRAQGRRRADRRVPRAPRGPSPRRAARARTRARGPRRRPRR